MKPFPTLRVLIYERRAFVIIITVFRDVYLATVMWPFSFSAPAVFLQELFKA
jgi:hypothetical protein